MRKFVSIFTLNNLDTLFSGSIISAQRKNQVTESGDRCRSWVAMIPAPKEKIRSEKDVALSIALKTGKLIQKNCPRSPGNLYT